MVSEWGVVHLSLEPLDTLRKLTTEKDYWERQFQTKLAVLKALMSLWMDFQRVAPIENRMGVVLVCSMVAILAQTGKSRLGAPKVYLMVKLKETMKVDYLIW